MGLQGLMVWPTKSSTAADLSKLLGMYGLIITRVKKAKGEEKTAGYREALRSRLYYAKCIYYFDTLK